MIYSRSFILLILLSFLLSCNAERPVKFHVGKPIVVNLPGPDKTVNPKLKFSFSSLDLFQNMHTINLNQFEVYGTFYTKDFTIYQVKNLDLLEDNLYISEVYLYFIDASLHKIQALTTKNMSDFFLSKYGGAKLVLKDRFNKDIAKDEGAVSLNSGNVEMNKNLNNYKLKWRGKDRIISYQVDESSQKNFESIEELIDLENQQEIKIKPTYVFTIRSNEYDQLLARVKYDEVRASIK